MKTYTSANMIVSLFCLTSIFATAEVNVEVARDEFGVNNPDSSIFESRRLHHRSETTSMSFDLQDASSKSGKANATKESLFTRNLVDVDELERDLRHNTRSFSYDSLAGGKSGKATGGRRMLDIEELDRQLYHKAGSLFYDTYAIGKSGKATASGVGRRVLDLDELDRELNDIMVSMSLGEVAVEKGSKSSKVAAQPLGKRIAGKSHKGKLVRRFLDVEEFDRELEDMASISMSIAPIVVAGSKSQKGAVASVTGTIDLKESKSKRLSSADGFTTTIIKLEEGDVDTSGKAQTSYVVVSKDTSNKSAKSQKTNIIGDITRSSNVDTSEGDVFQSYIELRSSSVSANDGSASAINGVNAAEESDAASSAIVKTGFALQSLIFLVVTAYMVF